MCCLSFSPSFSFSEGGQARGGREEEGGVGFRLIKHGTNEKVNRDNTVRGSEGGGEGRREGGGPGIGNVCELHHDGEKTNSKALNTTLNVYACVHLHTYIYTCTYTYLCISSKSLQICSHQSTSVKYFPKSRDFFSGPIETGPNVLFAEQRFSLWNSVMQANICPVSAVSEGGFMNTDLSRGEQGLRFFVGSYVTSWMSRRSS